MSSASPARLATILAGAVALTLTACVPLPPSQPVVPPAPPRTPPTTQPTTPPSTPPTTPPESEGPQVPDVPATTIDLTENDTGELYAGSDPITADGYSPDGGVDVVLQPTRGEPLVEEGAPYGDDSSGDEYLPDQTASNEGDLVQSTVGQIVMTDVDGSEYSCSGTVINSATGSIVVTAAHCLFSDSSLEDFAEIQFVPAYREGEQPFGVWEAEDWWYPEQYTASNDIWLAGGDDDSWMAFDYGFVRLAPNDEGQEIEEVTGGQGVSFTAETNGIVAVGYPAEPAPMNGELQRMCSDETAEYGHSDFPSYAFECAMGGGASGSGLISNLDPDTGAGLLVGTFSYGDAEVEHGPVLGGTAYNGYLTIQSGIE